MRSLKKAVAMLLLVVFTYSLFSVYPPLVHAAPPAPFKITDIKYSGGKIDFTWPAIPGTTNVRLTWHAPDASGTGATEEIRDLIQTTNTASISGLKSDYIYDIDVKLYDQGANLIGECLFFYLPRITFYAIQPNQTYDDISGGGREIGGKPKIQLQWVMPKAYYDANTTDGMLGVFVDASSSGVKSGMTAALISVYSNISSISTLGFKVNISSNTATLNDGGYGSKASVSITQNGTNYEAVVSNATAKATVSTTPVSGFQSQSIVLLGRSDSNASMPSALTGELPHSEIFPGAVYYMNIKPVCTDNNNDGVITVGNTGDLNGSALMGATSYTYTPIRFQLTKDSANNVYVKIYKINQGSLDLPRLYYQVQASDDPSVAGDWTVKKTLDDTYFSGSYAVTVLSGVNANNLIYYKIVVKSDSPNDRLESSKLPYTLSIDTDRPPLPTSIQIVKREMVYQTVGSNLEKSTNVTIQWDKPANWDAIQANTTVNNGIVYYLAINTSETESTAMPYPVLEAEGKTYPSATGTGFPLRYRVVAYIDTKSANLHQNGSKLEYTLKGFNLFQGEYWDSNGAGGSPVIATDNFNTRVNAEGYPTFLLPNKVYYLEMFSSKESDRSAITNDANYFAQDSDKMSDRSVITSFTTLTTTEMDVPMPSNLRLDVNNVVTNTNLTPTPTPTLPPPAKVNNIELLFDKVVIKDWSNYTTNHDATDKVYYDIYMGTRPDPQNCIPIGTTEKLNDDVTFTGVNDDASTSIRVAINKFTQANNATAYAAFGGYLLPNNTYYFYVKTRLVMKNTPTKTSMNTVILPVTTVDIGIVPPDDNQRKPLAPTDFTIAKDSSGNPMLSGYSVTFSWVRQETDVSYEIISTSARVLPGDLPASYSGDSIYQSFVNTFDSDYDTVPSKVLLDPKLLNSSKFTYDPATKVCTFTIDKWLFPNKLYYFSLRAVRNTTQAASYWVSIPVTTSLIEAPTQLEVVSDAQLGFFWSDADPKLVADDFKIYIKGPSDSDYNLVTRSQSTIVKDSDNRTYYARVMGLKLNTSYDVRVFKGTNTLVYEKREMTTRDGYHELLVRWKGRSIQDYNSGYEVAIKSETDSDYTVLNNSDFQSYYNKSGLYLPYYEEETNTTNSGENKDYVYYYALIKTAETSLSDNITIHQPLKSNVKFFIKVRAIKKDPVDSAAVARSKYAGPVDTRTEFSQSDYDNNDQNEKEKAVFMDKLKSLEKGYFWRMASGSSAVCKIFLKSNLILSALKNTRDDNVVVDISELNVNIDNDVVYVPSTIVGTLNSLGKSLVLKTSGAEYTMRPKTVDMDSNTQMKTLESKSGVKDIYVALKVNRSLDRTGLPSGLSPVSTVNDFEMQAVPSTVTDTEITTLVNDRLYNKNTGLVVKKLNILANTYIGTGKDAAKTLDEYTNLLVKAVEQELSSYIDTTVESGKITGSIASITVFNSPMIARLAYSEAQGLKTPYVLYDGSSAWQKLTSNTSASSGIAQFNTAKTGKYVILLSQASTGDVAADYWAKDSVSKLLSQYDLSDVFPGSNTSFAPENIVTSKEMVLLFEKVTGRTAENAGLEIKSRLRNLGLDGIVNSNSAMKNISRQETAGVMAKLYAAKKGLDAGSLKPGANIFINDENAIRDDLYNSVVIVVDKKIMMLDANGSFNPKGTLTRAEVSVILVRLLQQTGDM